jgi:hypothetical protein
LKNASPKSSRAGACLINPMGELRPQFKFLGALLVCLCLGACAGPTVEQIHNGTLVYGNLRTTDDLQAVHPDWNYSLELERVDGGEILGNRALLLNEGTFYAAGLEPGVYRFTAMDVYAFLNSSFSTRVPLGGSVKYMTFTISKPRSVCFLGSYILGAEEWRAGRAARLGSGGGGVTNLGLKLDTSDTNLMVLKKLLLKLDDPELRARANAALNSGITDEKFGVGD